jgi:transcriptional regulator with XRE-family HTH domain
MQIVRWLITEPPNLLQKGNTPMSINFALIGKRVRETRKQQKISQEKLAELTDLSVSYISHIENARKQASLSSLLKIANALGITIDELLNGNQLYNPTEYQTDIDLLMSDCSGVEKRFIYELICAAKSIIRSNDWLANPSEK